MNRFFFRCHACGFVHETEDMRRNLHVGGRAILAHKVAAATKNRCAFSPGSSDLLVEASVRVAVEQLDADCQVQPVLGVTGVVVNVDGLRGALDASRSEH